MSSGTHDQFWYTTAHGVITIHAPVVPDVNISAAVSRSRGPTERLGARRRALEQLGETHQARPRTCRTVRGCIVVDDHDGAQQRQLGSAPQAHDR